MRHGVRCSSIVDPLGIPAVFGAINPEQCMRNGDVPFLAGPGVVPPLSLTAPRTACRGDIAMHSGKSDPCRHAVQHSNGRLQWRTKNSKCIATDYTDRFFRVI